MASQGQNPQEIIRVMGELVEARKKGTPIEKAIADAFAPKENPTPGAGNPMENEAGQSQTPQEGSPSLWAGQG